MGRRQRGASVLLESVHRRPAFLHSSAWVTGLDPCRFPLFESLDPEYPPKLPYNLWRLEQDCQPQALYRPMAKKLLINNKNGGSPTIPFVTGVKSAREHWSRSPTWLPCPDTGA
jgi:hypothetical protein